MMNQHFLYERKISIATMHHKEKIIAPLFSNAFQSVCSVPENFNTDVFGTFSGEIERNLDPISTAKQKCLKAMEISGMDVAIASEGSFGVHPTLFFAHADTEIVLLLDKKNNLEIIAQEISTQTNFSGSVINNYSDLESFAESVQFPSHAIILRKSADAKEDVFKGITSYKNLELTYNLLMNKYKSVYAETDMRAMYNPTRQLVISKAVEKLIEKINSLCPVCKTPGYSVKNIITGLPCELCNTPTNSTLSHQYVCSVCQHIENKMHPNNKFYEEPMFCDRCNP